jgi:hypothetical protein
MREKQAATVEERRDGMMVVVVVARGSISIMARTTLAQCV